MNKGYHNKAIKVRVIKQGALGHLGIKNGL